MTLVPIDWRAVRVANLMSPRAVVVIGNEFLHLQARGIGSASFGWIHRTHHQKTERER